MLYCTLFSLLIINIMIPVYFVLWKEHMEVNYLGVFCALMEPSIMISFCIWHVFFLIANFPSIFREWILKRKFWGKIWWIFKKKFWWVFALFPEKKNFISKFLKKVFWFWNFLATSVKRSWKKLITHWQLNEINDWVSC